MEGRTMPHIPARRIVAVSILFLVLIQSARAAGDDLTALDRYIAKPDPSYSYKLIDTVKGDGQTTFILEMTSQTWLTAKEVDRPVWKHWLLIVKPGEVKSSKALLLISGGSNHR